MNNLLFQIKIILIAVVVAAFIDISYYPVFIVQTPQGQGTSVTVQNTAKGQTSMQISEKGDTIIDYMSNREPILSTYRIGFILTFFLFAILFYLELALCLYIISFNRMRNHTTFKKKLFVIICVLIITVCIIFITYLNIN